MTVAALNMRKRFSKSFVVAGILLVGIVAGIFVYEFYGRKNRPEPTPQIPVVRTVEVSKAFELETKTYPGVAKESQIAKLSFRVPGKMIESNIKIGARIERNGLIARLDPRDFELAVERLEAELRSAESLFGAMKTGARPEDVSSLESQLAAATSAFETAETNLNRFTALLADQVASQAQFDLAKTQYDTAKGQKETLQNELEKAKTGARKEDIDAMEAKILGLKASLNTAKNALEDTFLRAPFDGMIVEKFIEDYEVVAPGVPILSFIDASKIDVAVSLPEEIVVRMDDVREYRVEFEMYPGRTFPATLKEFGLAVQRGRQSYPLQVRVELPKDEETDKPLPVFPGMAASVLIDLARKRNEQENPPQIVPLAALVGDDSNQNAAVWVLESENVTEKTFRVARRSVRLLRIVGDEAEIEGELKPNEKIVSAGAKFLTEGQIVRIDR